MKVTYALIGVALLLLLGVGYYLYQQKSVDPLYDGIDPSLTMFSISSLAFAHNAMIPAKYTCDAENTSPPLSISGIPSGTVSIAITMDDPDVPKALKADGMFDHWVLYGIPVQKGQTTLEIAGASAPGPQGLNGKGEAAYTGPCPPPDFQPTQHRYFFKVYALSTELSFFKPPTKAELEAAITGNVLGTAELIGTYDRAKRGAQ